MFRVKDGLEDTVKEEGKSAKTKYESWYNEVQKRR